MTGELMKLAERVERLTGPDREVDLAIYAALNPNSDMAAMIRNRRGFDHEDGLAWDIHGASVCYEHYSNGRCWSNGGYPLPAVTSSLDAAMSLVPEKWSVSVSLNETGQHAQATLGRSYPTNKMVVQEGRTMPIALVVACLKARALARDERGHR